MEECKDCKVHSGILERLVRAESDIQKLFNFQNEKNRSSWQFVGTAALAFISMLVSIFIAWRN